MSSSIIKAFLTPLNQPSGAVTSSRNQKYLPQYFISAIGIYILFIVDTILQVSV